jgi:hypothetical protein
VAEVIERFTGDILMAVRAEGTPCRHDELDVADGRAACSGSGADSRLTTCPG